MFTFNAQHDCKAAGCVASGVRPIRQERHETDQNQDFIEHRPLARFLLNTHAFHNAHLIREVVPRHLTRPIPYVEDRKSHHHRIASILRASQNSKRAVNAAKAADRQEENTNLNELPAEAAGRGKKRQRTNNDLPYEPCGSGQSAVDQLAT